VLLESERFETKECDVSETNDWNAKIIAEFRANEGRVGGGFEGAPITLVHHRGRRSGREYVSPMMYLVAEGDAATIYVFGSKSGAPTHPDWYYNLTAAGLAQVEVGTDTYQVTVEDLTGEMRDRVFEEQARRYPGFAEYAEKTAGIRTIPVLALRRKQA
jgi:deazaflavin-dependent oxidoreductase (nitroreductase family)